MLTLHQEHAEQQDVDDERGEHATEDIALPVSCRSSDLTISSPLRAEVSHSRFEA